jgi:hypothetical protein
MSQKLIALAAWTSVAILAYAPLTHVGFVYSVNLNLAPLLMRADVRTCVHFLNT